MAGPGVGPHLVPLPVPRRHLLEGPPARPGHLPGRGGGDRSQSIDGRREILGHAVGDAETETFWAEFLRGLRDRGLAVNGSGHAGGLGVQLVVSDAHRGLTAAVGQVLAGAAWQRCRVHFMRNLLAKVPRGQTGMVAALVRTVFAQPTPGQVRDQVDVVAVQLADKFGGAAELLLDAKADITAFADFPQAHGVKIWSNNPIERLNREIKRRTNVVGIFPNPAAIDRLVGAILIEAHDEWQAADRRYLSEASMAALTPTRHAELTPDRADTPNGIIKTSRATHVASFYTTPRAAIQVPTAGSVLWAMPQPVQRQQIGLEVGGDTDRLGGVRC